MKNPARKKMRPLLSPFVDGELGPRERILVEQHMACCTQSAQEAADLRALSSLVRLGMEEAAEEEDWSTFSGQVMERLLPEKLPFFQRLHIQLAELWAYKRSWVAAGATAAALVVLGFVMWTSPAPPTGYKNTHLSIQTVSTKGPSLKTIVTHTETGDAIVWVVEESPPEEGEAKTPFEEEKAALAPHQAGAL